MRGHLYCSPRCAREEGRHAVWRRVRAGLQTPVRPAAALAVVALAAAAPTMTALRALSRLERLDPPSFRVPDRRSRATAVIESVTRSDGGTSIEGRAPDGAAVFLFAPSGFLGTAAVEGGRFRFEEIRSGGPYRVGCIPLSAEALSPAAPAEPLPLLSPPPQGRSSAAPDLTRGPRESRAVAVTFDAGSSDRGASAILDLLAARGLRTTIFLTGDFVKRHRDLARRIASDSHEVGNHTNTHPHLTTYAADGRQATRPGVDREFLFRELQETARLYREATGHNLAPLWRAPFGEHNGEIRRWAAEAGYWHVGWTAGRAGLDGMDWISDPAAPGYRGSDELLDRLVRRAENGGIVLLHLGSERPDPVGARLGSLFDGLAARGFRFARASEFLTDAGYTPERLASFGSVSPSGSR
jgi:peptidoglycan/xylan/chitin deacetylase (PgdA/CDA1 family)